VRGNIHDSSRITAHANSGVKAPMIMRYSKFILLLLLASELILSLSERSSFGDGHH
jgi:hypothetical protein